MEVKRLQQWFMDGSEAEMFPNKKQALGDGSGSLFAGVQPSSVPSWGNASGFSSVSTPLNERLFDNDTIQNINFDERNVPPVNTGHLSTASNHFGNFTSFGLSMSRSPEPSLFSVDYGGIRKVKVSEVRDSENLTPISIGPSRTEEAGVVTTTHDYSKVDNISKVDNSSVSMVLTYGGEDATVITLGDSFGRDEDNFLSASQTFRKGDFTKLAMGYNNEADSSIMPMSISFNKSNIDIISTPEDLCKGDNSVISIENPSEKDDDITPMRQAYNGDNCVSESNNFNYKVSTTSLAQSSSKCQSHGLSVSHPLEKGESNIISFGGGHYDANTSGRLMCSYNLPLRQTQSLDTHNPKDLVVKNTNPVICAPQGLSAGAESASKRKEDHKSIKKIPSNNFPSNVRSLLSTGILDDVPVKYTAWSREVLRGIIKGSGYLCGCQACNFSKVINAYEFERHAGCKTKHPNNHIYFDNGKTIYGVVQELRSTPQNMLFDILQTITGSPINQKSFRLWKESYLAATRELQRIYGKDERKQLL